MLSLLAILIMLRIAATVVMMFSLMTANASKNANRGQGTGNLIQTAELSRLSPVLKEYADPAEMVIWAYCLMSNHIHLIVVPRREDSLSRGVGLAHRQYAAWLNREEKLSGHLWANRYYSTPLDEAHHWAAVRYVERNPVRAGMVEWAEDYRWSSAAANCGAGEGVGVVSSVGDTARGTGNLIQTAELSRPSPVAGRDASPVSHCAGRNASSVSLAVDLLSPSRPYPGPVEDWSAWLAEEPDDEQVARLRLTTRTGRPCGERGFVSMLEKMLGRRLLPRKPGRRPAKESTEEKGQTDLFQKHI